MKNKAKKPMELYVHIPFCVKKCDYCDFLSGPAGKERQREYFQSLGREIAAVPEFPDREITTVFIGGGTPSVPDPALMGAILDQCDSFADGKKSAHEQRFSVVRRTGSLIGGMTG